MLQAFIEGISCQNKLDNAHGDLLLQGLAERSCPTRVNRFNPYSWMTLCITFRVRTRFADLGLCYSTSERLWQVHVQWW